MKGCLISYMLHVGTATVLASMFVFAVTAPLVMSGEPAAAPSGKAPHDALPRTSPSPTEERDRFHQILDRARNEEDGVHDACGGLIHVGDQSSVPHLIRVLRLFPDEEIAGKPGRGIVCTQGHCVMALERITGAKVGVSYSSWKRWWSENHPGQPLEEPHNKPLNPSGAKNAPAG